MLFPLLLHPIFFKYQKASETTKGSRMMFFSPVRQNVFEKSVILSPMQQIFLYQILFWKQKGSPTSFLGVMRHKKIFDRTVMSRPPARALLCMTIFDTRSFLKCRCVPLRDLSLVLKKNSKVNGEILFWCIKISIPEIFRNTERLNGYTTKFIGTMRHKENRKNSWCSPALVCEKFFDTMFSANQRKALIRFSKALWDEKLSTKKRDTPILCMKFIWYTKNFETTKCSPMFFFTIVRQKFLTEPWCPPPLHGNFGTRYFFETQNGSLTIFLGTVKQKQVDRKSWCRFPFSSSHNFISIPESFWNDEWFPNEVF